MNEDTIYLEGGEDLPRSLKDEIHDIKHGNDTALIKWIKIKRIERKFRRQENGDAKRSRFIWTTLALSVVPLILWLSFKSLHSAIGWILFLPLAVFVGYNSWKYVSGEVASQVDSAGTPQDDPNIVDAEVVDPDQTGPIDTRRRRPKRRRSNPASPPPDTSERRLVPMIKENKPLAAKVVALLIVIFGTTWFVLDVFTNWSTGSNIFAAVISVIVTVAAGSAAWWFTNRRKTLSEANAEAPEKMHFDEPSTSAPSASRSGKGVKFAGAFALVAIALIVGILFGKTTAPNGQVVATDGVSQEQFSQVQAQLEEAMKKYDEANGRIGDLESQLNTANAQPAVQPVNNVTKTLTDGERAVLSAVVAQGIDANSVRFGSDIDVNWARKVSAGGTTFGEAIYTPQDVVAFLNSNTSEAKAALASLRDTTKASDAELKNVSYWTSLQYTTPVQWNGNTFYTNGAAVDGGSKVDPAGSVGIYYTGPQTLNLVKDGKLDPKSLFGFRGACANPQIAPPTPPQGGGHVPPTYGPPSPPPVMPPPPVNPPPPPTGGCEEPNGCLPPPPCSPQDCPPPPPCSPEDCPPPPPCSPEDCPPPPCSPQDCPPPPCSPQDCPPPPPVKCEDVAEGELCGTPDTGGEQQPVQDNDPVLVQPTPGYDPNEAEDTLENQGPNCTLTNTCGTDSTEDGTQAGEGGTSPGNGAGNVIPGGDAGVNPDANGEAPDAGTGAGTGNDAGSEEAQNEGSGDTSGQGDPLPGLSLPNVESAPAPAAPAAAPAYVAPAVAESTYVAPVEQSGSTQSVYEEAPAASSYSAPADTSVSSFSASDQSSSSSASDNSSSFDSSASSTVSSITPSSSSSASVIADSLPGAA